MSTPKCPTCGVGLSAKYRAAGAKHVYRVSRSRLRRHPELAMIRRVRVACPWVAA